MGFCCFFFFFYNIITIARTTNTITSTVVLLLLPLLSSDEHAWWACRLVYYRFVRRMKWFDCRDQPSTWQRAELQWWFWRTRLTWSNWSGRHSVRETHYPRQRTSRGNLPPMSSAGNHVHEFMGALWGEWPKIKKIDGWTAVHLIGP